MKNEWKEKSVGEILQLEYGKPLDKSDRKPNGRFPVYGANGEKDRTDKFYHNKPSIIVGRKGSAGEITLTTKQFWPLDVTYFVTFDEQQHDLRFLYYLLTTLDLPKFAKGVKPGINRNEVYSQVAKVPPRPEQQRIVGTLDQAFEAIATATINAEKNLQNARSLFESHLRSVFTQRGAGWKQKTLEEIATTFGRGKSKHRPRDEPKLYGGKYPFIQTGDIRNANHIITGYSQTYSDAGLAQSKLWPKGTICITIAANIAETGILGFDACFPDSVVGVVTNPKEAEVGFVEYLLQSFKVRIQAMGKGSAQANINMGTFENERFPFPPVTEQKQIVAKLDSLREETERLASVYGRKLATLEALKKSLLHQAFSGQL
jgi:type I restriction enzyme S subunit